jgi:hypothetical protein
MLIFYIHVTENDKKTVKDKPIANNQEGTNVVTCGSCIYAHLIEQHMFSDTGLYL